MGAEVQPEGFFLGSSSMGNHDQNSNGGSSSHHYNGLRSFLDTNVRDILRRTIVEHDAIFRDQVSELHRVLRVQTDLVNELKKKKLHASNTRTEPSSWLGHLPTQIATQSLVPVREKNAESIPSQSQFGGSSNKFEVLESRSNKARKNMFDLHLPADEFINSDDREKIKENYLPGNSSSRNCGTAPENALTFSFGCSEKAGAQEDALGSDLGSKRTNVMTTLNQPIRRTNTSALTGLWGPSSWCGENLVYDLSTGRKSQLQGSLREAAVNSHNDKMRTSNTHLRSKTNDGRWFSHVLEAGCSKSNSNSVSQGLLPKKLQMSSRPMQHMLNSGHGLQNHAPNGNINKDLLRNRTILGSEFSERSHITSDVVCVESDSDPQILRPLSLGHSSDSTISRLHGVPSLGTLNSSPSQKLTTAQAHATFNSSASSISMSLQQQTQSHRIFANDRHVNRTNQRIGSGLPHQDGVHLSSRSMELAANVPSGSFDNLRCSNVNAGSDHLSIHGSGRTFTELHFMNYGKDLNLNAIPPSNSSSEQAAIKSQEKTGLKRKSDRLAEQQILGVSFLEKPDSLQNETTFHSSPALSLSRLSEHEVPAIDSKKTVIDINLPCDQVPELGEQVAAEAQPIESRKNSENCGLGDLIDLNSCVSEDDSSVPLAMTTERRITVEIDLEASAAPEGEEQNAIQRDESAEEQRAASPKSPEHNADPLPDKLVEAAAETILCLSVDFQSNLAETTWKPTDSSVAANLHWLADIASSHCDDNIDSKTDSSSRGKGSESTGDSSEEEGDYFELMTLQLTEMTEEEYMPNAIVQEKMKVDDSRSQLLPTRPRRGPTRRGRQRRDFQRDILPGLSSLSRQEVTEDLQRFGGMMRAKGHSWNLAPARRNSTRNGNARGRRRLMIDPPPAVGTSEASARPVEQLVNAEAGQEDGSPTPWGRTPKRPRGQRSPANVPPHFPGA